MTLTLVSLVGGIVLLVKGADWFVTGGAGIARRLGVSDLTIGLTIIALGTSMPELAVNLASSLGGANDLAVGNIVGSNTANILLILGITAALRPVHVQRSTAWKEIPLALLAIILVFTLGSDRLLDQSPVSAMSRSDGLALLGFFLVFLWYIVGMGRPENDGVDQLLHDPARRGVPTLLALLVGGGGILLLGGQLTVTGAVDIARLLGISEALIGVSVVAVGTSLPELATSVVAARRGQADLAVGNVIGSNIVNVFWILGLSATVHPLVFHETLIVDVCMAIAATVLLFFVIHTGALHRRIFFFWAQRDHHVIERREGVAMLLLYAGYIAYVVWRG